VFGEDQVKLKTWLKPLVRQLKNQSAIKVIRQLEEVLVGLPAGGAAEAVQKEINYFYEHQERMDYRAGRWRGQPIGSGPVGSHLPSGPVSIQETGAILEPARGRSLALFGNLLAQRPLAPPLSPRPTSRPCKKLRCAHGAWKGMLKVDLHTKADNDAALVYLNLLGTP
jgi:hypothetical protein